MYYEQVQGNLQKNGCMRFVSTNAIGTVPVVFSQTARLGYSNALVGNRTKVTIVSQIQTNLPVGKMTLVRGKKG